MDCPIRNEDPGTRERAFPRDVRDGAVVFRASSAMGLQGIVAKRRDSRYRSGRCRDWVKIKNMAHPAIERAMLIALSKRRTRR